MDIHFGMSRVLSFLHNSYLLPEHIQIHSQSGSSNFELHAPLCLRSWIRIVIENVNKISNHVKIGVIFQCAPLPLELSLISIN